jgi:SAM-dependent methyltransferase
LYHVLTHEMNVDPLMAVLDIAPSAQIQRRFTTLCRYVAIDVQGYTPEIIPLDVTRLEFPDNYFHLVLCSHVFEHIRNDRQAYAEIHRALVPGGRLVSQIPYITDGLPQELEQPDRHGHVRILTPGVFLDRLAGAGFDTCRVNYASAFPRYGFDRLDVFVSTKADKGLPVPAYDYRLLSWIQERAAEAKARAKDYARKPIST